MLKFKLDSIEGLADEVAAMYEQRDGAYFLKVDGLPVGGDVSGLKAQVETLLAEKKAADQKARDAAEDARKARDEKAKKEGDFEALSKSIQEKLDAAEAKLAEREKLDAKNAIDAAATQLAAELAEGNNAKLLKRFVADRLRYDDGAVKVTDNDGNLTVSSLQDLATEFKTNPDFTGLVVATKASGGGAEGGSGGAVTKSFNEMTGAELSELRKKNPTEYNRLKTEYYG